MERFIKMAVVHRPNSMGIDLPAGRSAEELCATDYHVIEMPDDLVEWAVVHRPTDCGVDLPAGASARELASTEYRIVEVEDA